MDASSSSKVTVEYHDPAGLFSLISKDIAARLPLRNLNWQSSTRPLRQIKSLHLEFVPDSFTKNSLRPPAQRIDSDGTTSFDIVRSGVDPRRNAVKERRHQIPGLQTSPYLKLYILRSDDKETYKTTERKKIREWIRDNAASNAKGKGENHDAFEWLIVHVVVPDTTAATEPRWRESSAKDWEESKELKERKQGMKLPGKSTRTVFDKLRADFNESGKSGQDRVGQIRLTRSQTSPDLLPIPALATTIEETDEERAKAWNDLMTKFKALILGPFDLRVRQYEADVAEQESRRSMPGFNFCTFFIHKEGLAKALESIGLVEDALVIYDELSLGLETVLRDIARGQAEGAATRFAPYTTDIKERIVGAGKPKTNGASVGNAKGDNEVDAVETTEQDYREKIVRSDISVFEFFSYLFSRQKALILRIANASSASSFAKDGGEDLVLISEVCWRAMSFMHNISRTLRHDLMAHNHALREKQGGSYFSNADIESLVCSWTYTVAGQIVDQTSSTAVDKFCSDLERRGSLANGVMDNDKLSSIAHPQRTTSLPPRRSRVLELQSRNSLQSASESDLMSPPMSPGFRIEESKPGGPAPGLLELVTYRAELVMMQRKMLELVAKQKGWLAGWASIREKMTTKMENVDLEDDDEQTAGDTNSDSEPDASSLLSPDLAAILESRETFHDAYERLSDNAMRYLVAATQTKSAESIMGDLAILKSQQGDYGYAVSYFQHVLPLYAADGWSLMQDEALKVHAKCLKELGRTEEHVTALLALVAKACGGVQAARVLGAKIQAFDEVVDVDGVLPELVTFSENLEKVITNHAEQFFSDIHLGREVMHPDDRDGFALRLYLRHLLDDEIKVDRVSARLVHVEDPSREIWLENAQPVRLERGLNEFDLTTGTVAFGPYIVDGIVLQAGKLIFEHALPEALGVRKSGASSESYKHRLLFLYPGQHAFNVEISREKNIHIDKPRHLEITLSSGWNEIERIGLKLKPASAGLRLHLADAAFNNIERTKEEEAKSGQISLASLKAFSSSLVRIPYWLDQAAPEIFVRLEAHYSTSKGSFVLPTSIKLPTELPLDVEVNDTFHLERLFSNFTVRTTTGAPLSITQATLETSVVYEVEAPPTLPLPMTVFEKQPVKLMYKISRKAKADGLRNKKAAALALNVCYYAIDDLILRTSRKVCAESLEKSPFMSLSRLLLPLLWERSKHLLSRGEIEMAVLLGEAKIPSFEDVGWREVIATLPASIQPELTDWLKSWHHVHSCLTIEHDVSEQELDHSIAMSVDVPQVEFVHKVSLAVQNQPQHLQHDSRVLVLGQPVTAQLTVNSTRNWSTAAILGPQNSNSNQADHCKDFVLDIQADSDCWLVGGQRRSHFKAEEGAEINFYVLLIPLKLGWHPLPNIDVQPVPADSGVDGDRKPQNQPAVSCETHCESAGRLVQVMRGLKVSRVHIPESAGVTNPSSRPGTATTVKDAG